MDNLWKMAHLFEKKRSADPRVVYIYPGVDLTSKKARNNFDCSRLD